MAGSTSILSCCPGSKVIAITRPADEAARNEKVDRRKVLGIADIGGLLLCMEVSLKELALTFVVPFLSCPSSAMFASVKRSFQVSSQPSLESWRQLFVLHRQRRDGLCESLRFLEYRTHYALPRLGSHSSAELVRNV